MYLVTIHCRFARKTHNQNPGARIFSQPAPKCTPAKRILIWAKSLGGGYIKDLCYREKQERLRTCASRGPILARVPLLGHILMRSLEKYVITVIPQVLAFSSEL